MVLLGPSGSGKSTLLNIVGGLDAPTSGSAAWRDHQLTGASEAELTRYRRDHVGFVFQFYNLIPSLTVRENVQLVAEIATRPMTPEEALALVGLSHRLDHFPSQLSGGEQQRVAGPGLRVAWAPTDAMPRCADFRTTCTVESGDSRAAKSATGSQSPQIDRRDGAKLPPPRRH